MMLLRSVNGSLDSQGLSIFPRGVAQLVEAVMIFKKELILNALVNGDTLLAYDGVAFFSDASGLRVNDNLLAGTGVTLATLQQMCFQQGRQLRALYQIQADTSGNLIPLFVRLRLKPFLQLKNSTVINPCQQQRARTGSYIKT